MKIVVYCDSPEERIQAWHLRSLMHHANLIQSWSEVDIDFPAYDECGAYWAPSNGGPCIKEEGHIERGDKEHLCP